MTALDVATAVAATGDGSFSAELSPDWEVWGPQGGERAILTGSVWGIDDGLPGLEHRVTEQPISRLSPDGLLSIRERLAGTDAVAPHPFWLNFEQRPLHWIEDWDNRSAGEPHQQNWYRFLDGETFDDLWLDACRSLVVLDIDSWGRQPGRTPERSITSRRPSNSRSDSSATPEISPGCSVMPTHPSLQTAWSPTPERSGHRTSA